MISPFSLYTFLSKLTIHAQLFMHCLKVPCSNLCKWYDKSTNNILRLFLKLSNYAHATVNEHAQLLRTPYECVVITYFYDNIVGTAHSIPSTLKLNSIRAHRNALRWLLFRTKSIHMFDCILSNSLK